VIDEYQMIADPFRGIHYELAVALAPPGTQLLLLSGSVANPGEVAGWLRRLGRDAALVRHDERPVPLEEIDLLGLPDAAPPAVTGFWPRRIFSALRAGLGPVLVFAPRRNAAERFAASLAPFARQPLPLSREQEAVAGGPLAKLLKSRIAYHHSGLPYAVRAGLVEPLAKNGQLDVVVATMGLAAGINFSMRSVLVTDTRYFAGAAERHVTPDELLQMFGRAGRRGLDETGHVLATPKQPRLHDARPLRLRRSEPLDWPVLLAVIRGAARRGKDPFAAAAEIGGRLFADRRIEIGVEHSLATGPRPCGLRVDAERARFARRRVAEMLLPEGNWEREGPVGRVPLGGALVWDGRRFRPALAVARSLEGVGEGPICKLENPKRYGRERVVGTFAGPGEPGPGGEVIVARWLRKRARARSVPFDRAEELLLPLVAGEPEGAVPAGLVVRGKHLAAQIDFAGVMAGATLDSSGRGLIDPPRRESFPEPCRECPDREGWCAEARPAGGTAFAWRQLGLVEPGGAPTLRGEVFSFFNGGEGLAVAAALEDPDYPIDEILFDLANLRAGHRFAGLDSPYGGRLGLLCQQAFGRADYPGFLEHGVPVQYGAGASEAIRAIVERRSTKQRLASDELRPGDIERALVEWRSLLRHLAHAPDLDWSRWRELKVAAGRFVEATRSPAASGFPPLLPQQGRRSPDARCGDGMA
jgi:hypothetical protein